MTVVSDFSHNPQVNDVRLVTGSSAAVNFPNLPVLLVRFKTYAANIGKFYIGETANDLYWEMSAGEDTGWVAVQNMNHLWYKNSSGTADFMTYWTQR